VRVRAVSWYAARFPIEASAKLLRQAGDRARMKLAGGGTELHPRVDAGRAQSLAPKPAMMRGVRMDESPRMSADVETRAPARIFLLAGHCRVMRSARRDHDRLRRHDAARDHVRPHGRM